MNVYQWTRNERIKGKTAGIKSCSGGEYLIWHEDFNCPPDPNALPPGYIFCDICEPPSSGKMNIYGYSIPRMRKLGLGQRMKCTACDGAGRYRYEKKEPQPKRRRRRSVIQGEFWTEEEIAVLLEDYENLTRKELEMKLVTRTWRSIVAKASSYKLTRRQLTRKDNSK